MTTDAKHSVLHILHYYVLKIGMYRFMSTEFHCRVCRRSKLQQRSLGFKGIDEQSAVQWAAF